MSCRLLWWGWKSILANGILIMLLQPENLLLDHQGLLKISDFGMLHLLFARTANVRETCVCVCVCVCVCFLMSGPAHVCMHQCSCLHAYVGVLLELVLGNRNQTLKLALPQHHVVLGCLFSNALKSLLLMHHRISRFARSRRKCWTLQNFVWNSQLCCSWGCVLFLFAFCFVVYIDGFKHILVIVCVFVSVC